MRLHRFLKSQWFELLVVAFAVWFMVTACRTGFFQSVVYFK